MSRLRCPGCQTINPLDSNYCRGCGARFLAPLLETGLNKKTVGKGRTALITVVCVIGFCALCAGIGSLSKRDREPDHRAINSDATSNVVAPAPSATVENFASVKKKAQTLLNYSREATFTAEELRPFDAVRKQLLAIPKEDKNYKEARLLDKKLLEKSAVFGAEIVLMGEKPNEVDLRFAFNVYLRDRLNDYDSSEYIAYSPAEKEYVKGEPFWVSTLRLRAKNGFGAYIVKDVKFYIRHKKVLLAEGL